MTRTGAGMLSKTSIVLILGIVTLTCAYLPFLTGFRTSRELLFGIAIMFGVGITMAPISFFGGVLVMYTAVTLFFSKSFGIEHHIYLLLSCSVLACVGMSTYRLWADKKKIIYNLICVIAIVNVVLGAIQFAGIQFPHKMLYRSAVGFMTNPNELSSLMAICLPFFFRRLWAYLIPVLILGMVLSQSLQGPLMASVVAVAYLWMRYGRRGMLYTLMPVILAGWAFVVFVDKDFSIDSHLNSRGITWKKTTSATLEKPVFGWGWGQYRVVVPLITGPATMGEQWTSVAFRQIEDYDAMNRVLERITGTDDIVQIKEYLYKQEHNVKATMLHAHNEYVEAAFSFGYFGLLLMVLFIWSTVAKGLRSTDRIPVLSFGAACLCATVFFVWQLIPFITLTILLISIIHGEANELA